MGHLKLWVSVKLGKGLWYNVPCRALVLRRFMLEPL